MFDSRACCAYHVLRACVMAVFTCLHLRHPDELVCDHSTLLLAVLASQVGSDCVASGHPLSVLIEASLGMSTPANETRRRH
eukprot:2307524-Rhodomonas_salina.1